ncbi:MAG: hypothetical protein MUF49_03560 [Oculatellaceae cyanobacterium Prado106]|nr:hypothetical protein [Oculatellaceae cyanobacterium Prado106]
MVIVVIGFNVAISLVCLAIAGRIWKLRSALAKAADALDSAERATDRVLSRAPQGIDRGQSGTYRLRQQYRQLELKLLQVQQILKVLGLAPLVWQWYGKQSKFQQFLQTSTPKSSGNRSSR